MGSAPHIYRGRPVPYVAVWEGEHLPLPELTLRKVGGVPRLGYIRETPRDRDDFGRLLPPLAHTPGRGVPDWTLMHPARQARAMDQLLCQVCAGSTLSPEGSLFVLPDRADSGPVREGEVTTVPPLHEACARTSLRRCPALHPGTAAARVRYPMTWGISGALYDPATLWPVPGKHDCKLRDGDPAELWVIAYRIAVSLHGCTPVDLGALLALP